MTQLSHQQFISTSHKNINALQIFLTARQKPRTGPKQLSGIPKLPRDFKMSLKERSQPDSLVEVPDSSFSFHFVIFHLLNLALLQSREISVSKTQRDQWSSSPYLRPYFLKISRNSITQVRLLQTI